MIILAGASSGIGLATAKEFMNNCYTVCNASRKTAPDHKIISYSVDVSNTKSIDDAIADIEMKHGRLDILINNAGFSMAAPIESVLDSDYRYLFEVNLFGAIHAINKAVPIMKRNGGGRIINVSSLGSTSPIPYDPYY